MAKMGVAVWNYRGGTVAERIERLAGLGFDAVSIGGFEVDAAGDAELDDIAATVKRLALPLTIHAKLPNPDDAGSIEQYRLFIERVSRWHGRSGAVTGLTFDVRYAPASHMPHFALAVEAFRGTGVFVCCEDLPLDASVMEAMAPVLSNGADRVGMLLDVGHLHLRQAKAGKTDRQEYIAAISRVPLPIYEIHIHNNFGDRDAHMPLMTGTSPLDTICEGLKKAGFDGIMTLETVPGWNGYPEEEDLPMAEASRELWMALWQGQISK